MKKRAQAAMEFLMTYGWAILVVLAAIGALAYFGVLDPSQFVNERCTIGSEFNCNNEQVTSTQATLSLVNTQTELVTINTVSLNGSCFTGTEQAVGADVSTRDSTSVLTFNCPSGSNAAGELAELDIRVNYTRGDESISRIASGEFLARVAE